MLNTLSDRGSNPFSHLLMTAVALMLVAPAVVAAEGDIRVEDGKLFERLDADGDGSLTASEIPKNQQRLFERLLRLGDSDGDQALTDSEWQTATEPSRPPKPIEEPRSANLPGADAVRLLLLKLDVNGDTTLTADEAPKELQPIFDRIVEQLDRNSDGKVQRMELGRGGPQLSRIAQRAARQFDVNIEKELKRLEREQGSAAKRFEVELTPEQILSDPKQALALFEQFDRNNDGQLKLEEVPEQARGRFRRLSRLVDRDRNGQLSKQEFLAASGRVSQMMRSQSMSDRPLSTTEPTAADSQMQRNDADELASRLIDRMLERLDHNKDGQIQRSEARGQLAQRFDQADQNGDGQLDNAEMLAVRAALAKRLNSKKSRD